jgi:hypothetical protein
MRMLCLFTCLTLMSACSPLGVRCDSRLRPINPRQPVTSRQQSPENTAAPKVSAPALRGPVKP